VKTYLLVIVLLLLTVGIALTGLFVGSFETSWATIYRLLTQYDPADTSQYVILHLRLPRLLLAFLAGGALASVGYLIQALVNNPLADPYILGTASGAALGANIVFFGLLPIQVGGIYLPPVFAFLGALAVTFLAISIAYKKGQIISTQLLLGGVALSSLLTAITSLITFLSDSEDKLRSIIFWTMGSFERAQWPDIPLLLMVVVLFTLFFSFLHKQINILLLGENRAFQLGVNTSLLKWIILGSTSLLTGIAVATCGTIGFVGLIIPHLVRGLFGATGKYNTLFSVWVGGLFMQTCDLLSRLVYPPAGLPIGIVTSFVGVPFFLYLLLGKNYRFE
jgi:iron complex transport system permease protein